jgi:hypothetical protein
MLIRIIWVPYSNREHKALRQKPNDAYELFFNQNQVVISYSVLPNSKSVI